MDLDMGMGYPQNKMDSRERFERLMAMIREGHDEIMQNRPDH